MSGRRVGVYTSVFGTRSVSRAVGPAMRPGGRAGGSDGARANSTLHCAVSVAELCTISEHKSIFVQCGPNPIVFDPSLSNPSRIRPNSAEHDRIRSKSGHLCPNVWPCRPKSANFGLGSRSMPIELGRD